MFDIHKFNCVIGIENVAGDVFKSVPKGDAIFTKFRLDIQSLSFLLVDFYF